MAAIGAPLGNRNAAHDKPWTNALRRALLAEDGKKLRACADKLISEAEAGNVIALKEIADRLEGKPAQAIVGADGGPIEVSVGWLKQRGR